MSNNQIKKEKIKMKKVRFTLFSIFLLFSFFFFLSSCATTTTAAPAKAQPDPFAFIQPAIDKTAEKFIGKLNAKSRIALTAPSCTDESLSKYVFTQLYEKFLDVFNDMPDRTNIDMARAEIKLGLSGEIDDRTAAAIGKFLGANVVVFGEIPDYGTPRQRLVYRALEVETGRMLAISTERF